MRTATEVFVSDLLEARHPLFHAELTEQLARFGISLREIPGTRDIWCRDYMPVPIGCGRFVQFTYAPDYLADEPRLLTPAEVAEQIVGTSRRSELVIDGGNIVRRGKTAITTDKIFAENAPRSPRRITAELRDALEVERLVVIPIEPGEMFGHADGVLHLLDERSALVNDYTSIDPDYGARLGRALHDHGIESIPLPYAPDLSDAGDVPAATGVYVNLLETPRAVFVPMYCLPADAIAVSGLKKSSGRQIVPIDCRSIARDGGSLHCATWDSTRICP
jgi:agmatine deiminase